MKPEKPISTEQACSTMKVHTLRDYTGSQSTHLAIDFEAAVQAHLVHYGLLGLNGDIEEVSCKELSEIEDRSTICWELHCCLTAASPTKEPEPATLESALGT